MDSNAKFWAIFWGLAACVAIALIIGVTSYARFATDQFVKGGYHECTIPGNQGTKWCR